MSSMTTVLPPAEFLHRTGALTSAPHSAPYVRASILFVGFAVGYTPAHLHLGDEVDAQASRVPTAVGPRCGPRCVLARVVSSSSEHIRGTNISALYVDVYIGSRLQASVY